MNELPQNQRLVSEAAFLAARACLSVVASALRPEECRDALEEFHRVIAAAIESYGIQARRMEHRLRPSRN